MPNAASAAGTGTPVAGDHSNATELASPISEESIETPIGDLGSHREDEPAPDDVVESPAPEAPVRLKGKSLAQVYEEFAGLEKEYSRQGNELGEARNLLRQTLELSLKQPGASTATEDVDPEPTDDEILADPKAAVGKLVAKAVKPLNQAVAAAEQRAMMMEFEGRHPGYRQEAASPEFQAWVKESPYRTRMFQAAASFDMEAAGDLFAAWGEAKTVRTAAAGKDPVQEKRDAIKHTTTETGGAGKTVSGKSGKRIYKSTELTRLYIHDRERYNEMMPEIQAAFREGRVR